MEHELQKKLDVRLRRSEVPLPVTARIDAHAEVLRSQVRKEQSRILRRFVVHGVVFVVSFVFTTGAATLGILLWVDPQNIGALVAVGVIGSLIFVATFASVRLVVLHGLLNDYEPDEDPGVEHHVGKSIAYALLALVLAMLLTGLIIQTASAARSEIMGTSEHAT